MAKADAEAVLETPEGEQREHRRNRPPKNKPPRNRERRQEPPEPEGGPTFWQQVASVAKADWGPRAHIYLYRVEPRIDRSRSGNPNYITKYAEAISEDRVLADHGSGKYKLMLNFRKPGAEQGDEIDSVYLDILNMQFPPKVPPGEWVDDPANKRWAWAKQHFPREGAERPAETIRETLQLADAIRGSQAPPDPVKTTLDTIRGVKELMGESTKPTDDLATVVSVAKDLAALQRPPDKDGMGTFLLQELAAQRAQTDKLLMMLLDNKKSNGSGVGSIKEITDGLKELLPAVKDFFPNLGDAVGAGGGSSRLSGWQEFAVAMVNAPAVASIVGPLAGAFSQAIMGRFMGGGAPGPATHAPQAHPPAHQPPPAGQPALPGNSLMPFLEMIAPPMVNHIRAMALPDNQPEDCGKDFAAWVLEGYGPDPRYGEALMALRSMGAQGIVAALQSTPIWKNKGPNGMMVSPEELQGKLMPFFTAFLTYDPNEANETGEDEDEDQGPPEVVTYREAQA